VSSKSVGYLLRAAVASAINLTTYVKNGSVLQKLVRHDERYSGEYRTGKTANSRLLVVSDDDVRRMENFNDFRSGETGNAAGCNLSLLREQFRPKRAC
jgi:hypothetical protein